MRKSSRDGRGQVKEQIIGGESLVATRDTDWINTGRECLEDALRENTELFQGVFNQAAVGMALTGPDRKVVQANRRICDFLGYEFEELFGTTLRAATHPDFMPQVDEQIRKLVDGEVESATIENLYVRKDGTTVWGEWTSSLIRDELGAPKFFISVVQNIDDRKNAEAEARKTVEMLGNSQRIAHLGSWDLDIAENKERWSDEVYRIFGLEPQSIDFTGYGFLDYVHPEDREKAKAAQDLAISQGKPYSVEYRLVRPDGTERIVYEYAELEYDNDGTPIRLSGTIEDVTEQRRTEKSLRESEGFFRVIFDQAAIGIAQLSPDGRFVKVNRKLSEILGYPQDELQSLHFWEVARPDDLELHRQQFRRLMSGEISDYNTEMRYSRADSTISWGNATLSAVRDEAGGPLYAILVAEDIDDRKRAELELQFAKERLEEAQRIARVGSWDWDPEENIEWWSDELYRIFGWEPGSIVLRGFDFLDYVHPDDRVRVKELERQAIRGNAPYSVDYRIIRSDGTERFVSEFGEVKFDANGKPQWRGVVQDVTRRKQAELALRRTTKQLTEAQRLAHVGLWEWDPDSNESDWSEETFRIFGLNPRDKAPTHQSFLQNILHEADHAPLERAMEETLRTGITYTTKFRIVRPDGEVRTMLESCERYVPAQTGRPRLRGVLQDITERKRAEDELWLREQELTEAQRVGSIGHWRLDLKKREFTYWSDELYRIFGVDKDSFVPTFDRFMATIHEDDLQASIENREAAFAEKRPYQFEYRIIRSSGEIRVIWGEARPEFDDNGESTMVFGITQDVTEARQRETELRQAQKMEAVGQLTGGVAHDFNNLLGVIIGNLELAQELTGSGTELGRLLESVVGAADRGAALTRRLLAFSRRQPLRPRLVKADELVEDTLELLGRTLGEAVEIENVSDDGLWSCMVDSAQLESAIVNMAINARDAMPGGGKLTIEISNAQIEDAYAASHVEVVPGEYVVVAISDSGSGISPEILEHVFEPFFTTKDVGAGSGLGLSMVYGFIKQSGGHVTIYSEVGEGTTIKLYLPRHVGESEDIPEPTQDGELTTANSETVLVVEDDEDLRALVVNILQSLGYDVLESGTGKAALEIIEDVRQVDLLLTDLVIPGGIGGRKLAELAQTQYPGLPVLYMSGYTEGAVIHQGRLEKGVQLLEKPFRKKDIAQAVRRTLDGRSA